MGLQKSETGSFAKSLPQPRELHFHAGARSRIAGRVRIGLGPVSFAARGRADGFHDGGAGAAVAGDAVQGLMRDDAVEVIRVGQGVRDDGFLAVVEARALAEQFQRPAKTNFPAASLRVR